MSAVDASARGPESKLPALSPDEDNHGRLQSPKAKFRNELKLWPALKPLRPSSKMN